MWSLLTQKMGAFDVRRKFGNIAGFAIEHSPADICGDRRLGHLRQRGTADRFEHDGVGAILRQRPELREEAECFE